MKKWRKEICLLVPLLLALAGLALPKSFKKDLKISLYEKRIQGFSLTGLSLVFYANIANSSSSPYYLSGYDYRFMVNQMEYLRLQTSLEEGLKINPKENTMISLPVKITYAHLFQVVKEAEKEDKAQCYVVGGMTFSNDRRKKGRLPFAFSGEFPIFKTPEIEFISLQVNDITIGGADLNFKVSFKNRNSFELMVNRINFGLSLGGKPIGEGIVSRDKNIESHGEKVSFLPLLINFFEVGKDVYDILNQPSALCRLSGEAEVQTIWGRLIIPFEKTDSIAISRTR